MKVFNKPPEYKFNVVGGGYLTHPGGRRDDELTREFTLDVFATTHLIHDETDLMAVFVESAGEIGNFDRKYLLFQRFLDVVIARATAELEQRRDE